MPAVLTMMMSAIRDVRLAERADSQGKQKKQKQAKPTIMILIMNMIMILIMIINTPPLPPRGKSVCLKHLLPRLLPRKKKTLRPGKNPKPKNRLQQGKEKAWREYAALKARHLVPESYVLAEVIARFKAEDRKWKRGYTPLMATWLRDRRWDDQPDKAPAPSYAPDENGRTRYVVESEQNYSTPSEFGSIFEMLKEKKNA